MPEKFWDPTKGEIRTDALLKSYAELERRLGRPRAGDVPGSPDDYRINLESPLLHDDPDMPAIRGRLHAAGFTNEQAQLVYDLAAERLEPLVAELAAVSEAERETERLVQRFGGAEPWQQVSRQLSAWGRKALPAPVFDALCTSYEGVVAMHRMMVNEEPALVQDGATMASPVSEAGLKVLMRDPRYWRDHDPAVVAQVREGFRALYPE
ncbi:MAG: hypothetical protein EA406_09885 [Rhodospirillales bacterium]|nr:MAG: hypothetical protein EA406_09885 [Rhodospirillales bacterium]